MPLLGLEPGAATAPGARRGAGGAGFRGAPGCPGEVAELACQAVLADVRPHVAVPVVMELAADIGVCEHGGLPSVGGLAGMLRPSTDRLPGGQGGHHA